MSNLPFVKYSGNGNDFIIINQPGLNLDSSLVKRLCDRHFGIGADGILAIGPSQTADIRMQIYNADGGEAEMCGNGLRCLVTFIDSISKEKKDKYSVQTMNTIYQVIRSNGAFAIEMSEIKDKDLYDLSVFRQFEKRFFVNTGVPHLVFLTKHARKIDIKQTAPQFRNHPMFPKGTNVSFVELLDSEKQLAYSRTYERGVEDETLSCGTGLTAVGLALSEWYGWKGEIHLQTLGGNQTVKIADKVLYSGEVTFCFRGDFEI